MEPKFVWATGRHGFPPRRINQPPPSQSAAGPSSSQNTSTSHYTPTTSSTAVAELSSSQTQRVMPAEQARLLEQQRQRQLKIQEERAKAYELAQQLAQLQKINDESRRSSLLDTLCSIDDVLNLPMHPDPPSIANGQLKVDLLNHQVRFPVLSLSIFQYFKRRNKLSSGFWTESIRSFPKEKKTDPCNFGSISWSMAGYAITLVRTSMHSN